MLHFLQFTCIFYQIRNIMRSSWISYHIIWLSDNYLMVAWLVTMYLMISTKLCLLRFSFSQTLFFARHSRWERYNQEHS